MTATHRPDHSAPSEHPISCPSLIGNQVPTASEKGNETLLNMAFISSLLNMELRSPSQIASPSLAYNTGTHLALVQESEERLLQELSRQREEKAALLSEKRQLEAQLAAFSERLAGEAGELPEGQAMRLEASEAQVRKLEKQLTEARAQLAEASSTVQVRA